MEHSITFASQYKKISLAHIDIVGAGASSEEYEIAKKNTFDDWHMVAPVRPSFNPPEPKTNFVEIPGASSSLDLSESVTGYPVYKNREGTFEFYVLNDYEPWEVLYSNVMGFLHGKRMKAYLEDDKGWYYEGRFFVGDYKAGSTGSEPWSKLTIGYNVGPYKWSDQDSLDDWLWDPFNFRTGVIFSALAKMLPVTETEKTMVYNNQFIGDAPFCPKFIVSTTGEQGVRMRFINELLGIDLEKVVPDGESTIYDFIFYGPEVTLTMQAVSGSGHVSIDFRQGRL